jgi:DNA mismatch repair protein MutS2
MTNRNNFDDMPDDTIYLRLLPIDDALTRLDKYLDRVFVAGIERIRVVHGKGTGQMKNAVREVLSSHSLVKSFREGYIGEGDAGVTVVYMHDRWKQRNVTQ